MRIIPVELGERRYPVIVAQDLLRQASGILARMGFSNPPVVVSNSRVLKLHGDPLLRSLEQTFGPAPLVQIGDGERFKDHSTLQRVYDAMFRARADRHSWVLAFGGGVVGDIAGFAAATFMRGIPYVNVPTTLLAQVDSAIGGKVGINVAQGKNLIGLFHQPSAVLSDTGILRTLPARELASGIYEAVKYGAIRSETFLRYLERRLDDVRHGQASALQHVVVEASRIKAQVVSGDEREDDLRMILNYGHTVGHALEAATEYRRFKHGEAVAWGMIAAVQFGRELDMLTSQEAERLARLIHRVRRLPSLLGIPPQSVWRALVHDKKFRSGTIRMILLSRLGETEVRNNIDPVHLRRFLKGFLARNGDFAR